MWSGIWSVATTRIGFWIESDLPDNRLRQEVACWFQCWKNATSFVWLVSKHWCYWCENGWVCSWGKSSFKILGLTFSSKLDWSSCIAYIAKTASKKIGALIRSTKFLSPEVALYLYKSTIRPCVEYCCHVWAGAPSCYLELLDKIQKQLCRTVDPLLLPLLNPWLIVEM